LLNEKEWGSPLDKRIRKDRILPIIGEKSDVHFMSNRVKATEGASGTVYVSLPVILKKMLLLIIYNACSERNSWHDP
jgi:hypothetical protein